MIFIGQQTGGQRHRLNGENRQQHAMRLKLQCRSYVRDMRREWATSRPPIVSVVCWHEREDRASLSTVQHSWRHRAWDWWQEQIEWIRDLRRIDLKQRSKNEVRWRDLFPQAALSHTSAAAGEPHWLVTYSVNEPSVQGSLQVRRAY